MTKFAAFPRFLLAIFLLANAPLDASVQNTPDSPIAAQLRQLLIDRLAVMDDVARAKWTKGRPVEDLPREAVVLESVTAAAEAEGLDSETAWAFFSAQITAAKEIQDRLYAVWQGQGHGPFADPPDLVAEIRPVISALTRDLIRVLKALSEAEPDVCATLHPIPHELRDDEAAWQTAIAPLCPPPPP